MYRYFVIVTVLSLISWNAFTQDFNDYKILRSEGTIPERFITSSSEKYSSERESIDNSDRKRVRKAKDKFFLESNFQIDDFLLSGKVLFNDQVSRYVGDVLGKLLKDDQKLRSRLDVYIVRSSYVNAYTTNSGIIFINLGLLSQLENEAQLAYILAHEVIHYTNKHSISRYVENRDIAYGRGSYRGSSYDERKLAQSRFSKANEIEADKEGLDLYLKSGYSLDELAGVFDVLRYAHVPFDITPYDKSFLETEYLKFPDNLFLTDVSPVKPDDDEDSLGSHPGALDRKQKILSRIEGVSNAEGKKFIVSEDEFYKVRKISRFELCNIYLNDRQYEDCFYHTYLLLQQSPGSVYLKKCMAKSLYGLSKYKTSGDFQEVHTPYQNVQGSPQQVSHFLTKLSEKELCAIAMHKLWRLKENVPDDKEISRLSTGIMHDFISLYEDDWTYFSRKSKEEIIKQMDSSAVLPDGTSSNEQKSKYDKLKKESVKDEKNYDFIKYGFVDLVSEPEFQVAFDEQVKIVAKEKEEQQKRETRKYKKLAEKQERINRKKGYAFGIDKIVFVNPFYYKVDQRKRDEIKYLASENAQKDFNELIRHNASLTGMDYTVIDHKNLNASDAGTFNDLMVLSDYIDEALEHGADLKFINNTSADLRALREKYGTKYFCWTGVIAVKEKKNVSVGSFIYGLVVWPVMPFVIYGAIKPANEYFLTSVLVDLESGEIMYNRFINYDYRDRRDLLNACMYDLFHQFKNKRKN